MQEYKVEIEIDEDGNIRAETKGMQGEVCVGELDAILMEIEGKRSGKDKPEFYQKTKNENIKIKIKMER